MERKKLVDEIVNFCIKYGLFNNSYKEKNIKESIRKQLKDVAFIENLINVVFVTAKHNKVLNTEAVMTLIIEIEKIRLQLEDRR